MSKDSQKRTFAQLGVAVEITDALAAHGISYPFAIQELTLPLALDGHDIIGQARTGMGKTLGYGIPLLDRVFDAGDVEELDGTPRGLVIAPTRELADQVAEDLLVAAENLPVRITKVYGGTPYEKQIAKLHKGTDIVVGTPGRIIDLHNQGELTLQRVAIVVLDEADEMLDMGFLPDVQKILRAVSNRGTARRHQTMLFSATMPGPILSLARSMMHNPIHIRAEQADASKTHKSTRQVVFSVHRMDKPAVLATILQSPGRGKTIIFSRTRRSTAAVAEDLAQRGFHVAAVHGDMPQSARERSLQAFRDGKVSILVATDVAARGIDVDDVTHVINFHVPDDPMTYIHRIGRTGRAGHSGTAVTFVDLDELHKWALIDAEVGVDKPKPPTWFSTSPELREAFDIADDVADSVGPARPVFGQKSFARQELDRTRSRSTGRSPARKARSRRLRGRQQGGRK
ncbi:DEAD/DEAH box helicase [Corynebacterium renale]|uniref:Superfamily II DNA/RNA helicase n=1 Tax=Corynebacterium renale TaxID=1724 RepID=A0A2A9DKF0_9CORY|nr:DEAD/DEAH box helicase [Corynebacterium renale]PFG27074.1 superfamily II DNA/RNA helicase [Corynebacterium renale]SQI24222.1 putative helicase [Corynebacterium renale]